MKNLVFAYGTLRDKAVQMKLLGRIPLTYPASLKGFIMDKLEYEGETYPIILEDTSTTKLIDGIYFEVNETELGILDEYETNAYRRIPVYLENGINAWVYCR